MKKKILKKMIEDLELRLHMMQVKIQKIESEIDTMKITPVQPIFPITPVRQQEAKCNVCNMRSADMTGYVCNNAACPHKVTVISSSSLKI